MQNEQVQKNSQNIQELSGAVEQISLNIEALLLERKTANAEQEAKVNMNRVSTALIILISLFTIIGFGKSYVDETAEKIFLRLDKMVEIMEEQDTVNDTQNLMLQRHELRIQVLEQK